VRVRVRLMMATIGVAGSVALSTGLVAANWDFPFTSAQEWYIACGYGCGLHGGDAAYALDLNYLTGGDTDCGAAVLAVRAGQVRRSACSGKKSDSGYGCHVEVLHGEVRTGTRSLYAHLMDPGSAKKRDERVCEGETIGRVGKTGSGGGSSCHLHFHLRTNGGRTAALPEPIDGRKNGAQECAAHTGLDEWQRFYSCIGYNCPQPQ